MEKRKLILGFFFTLVLLAVSCKKDTEVNKDTFKIENERVEATTQSVVIAGSYSYAGAIDAITLEMGRQPDLMDGDAYRALLEGTDYSVEVKNLRTNMTYYYRYAVEYGGKEPYRTEIKSFSTLEYNLPEVKSSEVVSVGVNRAEVSGEVLGDGGGDAVTLRGICWGTSHSPSVGDEYVNAGEGIGVFTCELTNLQPEKTYYARAFAGNSKGVAYGEELTFVTLAAGSLAEVRTVGISGNAMLQAMVSGEVVNEGTSSVIERGVCYSKEHYPTTSGLHVASGMGAGEYTCQLTNLEANMTYYVRAYAINSLGIAYGEEMSFVAQTETTVPTVTTGMVSDITVTSATGRGAVVSDGGAAVTRRGLCWSSAPNPTVEGTHADCGSGVGEFSGLMPHLTDMTTYYVRAYAENDLGLAYGEEVSFTVGQHEHPGLPTVILDEMFGTTISYSVTDDGGATVQEHGVCYSTSHDPTTAGGHINGGSGTGSFSVELSDLLPGTTYYLRLYATNSVGTAYSEEMSLTTPPNITPPTVGNVVVTDITQTTATVTANVIDDGGATVTERGVCWSTSPNPTTSGNHIAATEGGAGSFTVNLTGLTPNTTYYVKAYAINSEGTSYGEQMDFVTADLPQYTIEATADPTEGGTVSGGGTFQQGHSCTVTATANSGYIFINWTENGGVVATENSYSFIVNEDRSFVAHFALQTVPTVTTSPVTNITETTATGGGNVTSDGNATVIECGICWSTDHNPTTSDNHASSDTGTGTFTVDMTGLSPGTIYYVRAYAINSVGTGYGDEVSFAIPGTLSIDFESGDLANYNFDNTTSSYPWAISTTNPNSGSYCMVSGANGEPNGYSVIEITLNYVVDGTISFYSLISCETWDYGYFYIDDEQKLSQHGTSSWAIRSYDVTAGSHTFRWVYSKDSSVNGNDDCYYIDDIEFVGIAFDKNNK